MTTVAPDYDGVGYVADYTSEKSPPVGEGCSCTSETGDALKYLSYIGDAVPGTADWRPVDPYTVPVPVAGEGAGADPAQGPVCRYYSPTTGGAVGGQAGRKEAEGGPVQVCAEGGAQ